MKCTELIHDNLRALVNDLLRRLEKSLEPFANALEEFLAELFKSRLPSDWRERWHALVAEQAALGYTVQPQSVAELEAWIEVWARYRRLLPEAVAQPAAAHSAPSPDQSLSPAPATEPAKETEYDPPPPDAEKSESRDEPVDERPSEAGGIPWVYRIDHVLPQTLSGQQFFYEKLAEAQGYLEQIRRVLDVLGDKLDAVQPDEPTEVETEADRIEELIFRYNDAIESAQDTWLRDNLSGNAIAELAGMLTPATYGLPRFIDESQAQRANLQGLKVSERLGQRNVVMNRVVLAANVVDWVGVGAGALSGALVIRQVAKTGGKWAVTKLIAASAAGMAAEQIVEGGLRAAGANEETIRGFRLAVVVVLFVIYRRKLGSNAAEPPAKAATPGEHPPAPPARTSPVPAKPAPPSNPNPQAPAPPGGPGKNRSGDLDDAARAARTHPHGPTSRQGQLPVQPPAPASTGTGLVPTATEPLGKWGEVLLRKKFNGIGFKPRSGYKTSRSWRFVDWMVDDIAHESKAGLNVGLKSGIRDQALKDAELISLGKIKGAHWHFFRGAQSELLEFLSSLGIRYTVH